MKRGLLQRGFTLIELMVVVAIVSLLALLVAPSFQEMIVMQRLRGINAQLITDLQFARSEAVARGRNVLINLGSDSSQTCYVIYVNDESGFSRCDCRLGAGAACTAPESTEIRTVTSLRASTVSFVWPSVQDTGFGFDHITGGLITTPLDTALTPLALVQIDVRVDDDRRLRDIIKQTGRPAVCALNATRMQVAACSP